MKFRMSSSLTAIDITDVPDKTTKGINTCLRTWKSSGILNVETFILRPTKWNFTKE